MRNFILLFTLLIVCVVTSNSAPYEMNNNFVENKGQLHYTDGSKCQDILFYSIGNLSANISEHGLIYKIQSETEKGLPSPLSSNEEYANEYNTMRYNVNFVNGQGFNVVTESNSNAYINFYKGKDYFKSELYSQLILNDRSGNFSVKYYFNGTKLKYDLILKKAKDPKSLIMSFDGIKSLQIDDNGNLLISTGLGVIKEDKPYAYQIIDGKIIEVNCSFKINEDRILAFNTPNYDTSYDLIIDPSVNWITYLGGNGTDYLFETAFDKKSNLVSVGSYSSTNMPVTPGLITQQMGDADIYAAKFDSHYNFLWGTYVGGYGRDFNHSCDITSKNQVWISGDTYSDNFPVTNDAFQKDRIGDADAFVVKLDEDGKLIYSTLHGGGAYDSYTSAALDHNDNLWLVGRTASNDVYVSSNAFQLNNNGSMDCFITEYDNTGKLIYATFFGGSDGDMPDGIAVDDENNLIANGLTVSNDLPLKGNVFQNSYHGGYDSWIIKVSPLGKLLWSTYFGGSGFDLGNNVIADHDGNIIADGYTSSSDLATSTGSYQKDKKIGVDYYLVKFDKNGNLIWCTYFGGNNNEGKQVDYAQWGGMDVNPNNDILISFETLSTDLPTFSNSYQNANKGATDVYIGEFSSIGQLKQGSYLGGSGSDIPFNVKYKPGTNFIVSTGITSSTDFPVTSDAYQTNNAGGMDGYIAIIGNCDAISETHFNFNGIVKMPDYHRALMQLKFKADNMDDFAGQSTIDVTFRYNKALIDTINFKPGKIINTTENGDYENITVEFDISGITAGNQLLCDIYVHSLKSLDENATRLQIISSNINLPCVIEKYDAIDVNFACDQKSVTVDKADLNASPNDSKFETPLFIINPPAGIDFTKEPVTFKVQYELDKYRFQSVEGMQVIDNTTVGLSGILTLRSTPYMQNDTLFLGKLIGNLLDNSSPFTTMNFYDIYFDDVCLKMDNFDRMIFNKTLCVRFDHGIILFDPNNIEISPEPVTNSMNVTIHPAGSLPSRFKIFDSYGNEIYSRDVNFDAAGSSEETLSISTDNIPSGLYFAVVENVEGRTSKKFIIVK